MGLGAAEGLLDTGHLPKGLGEKIHMNKTIVTCLERPVNAEE